MPVGELDHRSGESAAQRMAATSVGWSTLAMETIMSTYTTATNRCLADSELDEVSGGEYAVNGALRAVTQWFQDHTPKTSGFGWDLARELCPPGA